MERTSLTVAQCQVQTSGPWFESVILPARPPMDMLLFSPNELVFNEHAGGEILMMKRREFITLLAAPLLRGRSLRARSSRRCQ